MLSLEISQRQENYKISTDVFQVDERRNSSFPHHFLIES